MTEDHGLPFQVSDIKDPAVLFESSNTEQVHRIERKVRDEIEQKEEVGERYRDLIDAADTIGEMRQCSENVVQPIQDMHQYCLKLEQGNNNAVTCKQEMDLSEDNILRCTTLSPSLFGCPLCPRFSTRNVKAIDRHLQNHNANAVHFEEKKIYRCNLPCRAGGHFHCPFCETTTIRKDTIKPHLEKCKNKSDFAQLMEASPPQPTLAVVTVSSVNSDHSYVLPSVSVSFVKTEHSSMETPAVVTDIIRDEEAPSMPEETDRPLSPTAVTNEDVITPVEEINVNLQSSHVKCPHCALILYKKNLSLHVRRKHDQVKDITAQSHLKSTCIDRTNGIYAVKKTSKGFSVPVHVQRKTWGQQHSTRCEMEDCRQNHLLEQQSGLSHGMCHHIRSLDYCDSIAAMEQLDSQVLQEMVENHLLTDAKAAMCKARQQKAEEAQVPLSVLVDLTESKNYICLSIHEQDLHHYSSLGRVLVTHNVKKNTWHCPCAKAHASCAHKYVAKWHLFQTHKHLLKTGSPNTSTAELH